MKSARTRYPLVFRKDMDSRTCLCSCLRTVVRPTFWHSNVYHDSFDDFNNFSIDISIRDDVPCRKRRGPVVRLNTSKKILCIAELPRSLWRLLSNPIYLITSLGICCEISIVSGFILFLPKYLETQFGLSKSFANVLTGKSPNLKVSSNP